MELKRKDQTAGLVAGVIYSGGGMCVLGEREKGDEFVVYVFEFVMSRSWKLQEKDGDGVLGEDTYGENEGGSTGEDT
ncbi:hypothetical protein Tco_0411473 [Tanacetum coccineum]